MIQWQTGNLFPETEKDIQHMLSYFWMYGVIAAVFTAAVCLLSRRSVGVAAFWAIVGFFLFGTIGWVSTPTFAFNFGLNWFILCGLGLFGVAASILGAEDGDTAAPGRNVAGLLAVGAFFMAGPIAWIMSTPVFHAYELRALAGGDPPTSNFTADIAPVDLHHARIVDGDLAWKLGDKVVESIPSLGSRVDLAPMHRQSMSGCIDTVDFEHRAHHECFANNELVWVAPLVHSSIFRYWSNHTTPGYVIVSAENPNRVLLVTNLPTLTSVGPTAEPQPIALNYFHGGYFEQHLERYLREHGYGGVGLTEASFEIDNNGRPYWVVTTYHNQVGFSGAVVDGAVIVDAQTGAIHRYSTQNAPSWVNLIQAEWIVEQHLNWWGTLVHGWPNFGGTDVVRPGDTVSLVDGNDGRSYYFDALRSSGTSSSMNSFVLVDTRTGAVRRYMESGADPSSAASSAEGNNVVRSSHYTSTTPVLYNVDSVPTYLIPMHDDNGLLKAYVFVSVRNYQITGGGLTIDQAYRQYQAALAQGSSLNADATVAHVQVTGVVEATAREGDTVFLLIQGQNNREYFASTTLSPELKWVRVGDHVTMGVEQGNASSMPILSFDDAATDLNPPAHQ